MSSVATTVNYVWLQRKQILFQNFWYEYMDTPPPSIAAVRNAGWVLSIISKLQNLSRAVKMCKWLTRMCICSHECLFHMEMFNWGIQFKYPFIVREDKKAPGCLYLQPSLEPVLNGTSPLLTSQCFGTMKNSTQENKRVSCLFDWFDNDKESLNSFDVSAQLADRGRKCQWKKKSWMILWGTTCSLEKTQVTEWESLWSIWKRK